MARVHAATRGVHAEESEVGMDSWPLSCWRPPSASLG